MSINPFKTASDRFRHEVSGLPLLPPYPPQMAIAEFGMGCFWGAERRFWTQPGVYVTLVGYAGGDMQQPDYRSVCRGDTGHAEVVRVVYDPALVSYETLLTVFWEAHNPTQGMRQGNDVGSQYRSMIIYHNDAQRALAERSLVQYQQRLEAGGYGVITTELRGSTTAEFYPAEEYHQQYLAKNPNGYCGLAGTGVSCEGVPVSS